MAKEAILLIGGGGHCHSCIDVIEQEGSFEIAGIVEKPGGAGSGEADLLGYPIIGTDEDLPKLRKKYKYALVTVGQIKSPDTRERLYDHLLALDFELPAIISPLAYVSKHASIGRGTIVMHHALVNAGAKIGDNCIINSKALIEHDAVVEDCCHIATMATVNGESKIKQGSFLGSGSVVLEGLTVGKRCVIGAGARVLDNLTDNLRHVD